MVEQDLSVETVSEPNEHAVELLLRTAAGFLQHVVDGKTPIPSMIRVAAVLVRQSRQLLGEQV